MNAKKKTIIFILSLGIIGMYGFPYMKNTFYNVMKISLGLSDIQLSRVWGMFGIVGMFSYIFGGYFADRISPRKILIIALSMSSILHMYVSFVPSYFVLLTISGLMGIVAVFAFFQASSKVLSSIGGKKQAGRVFGIYYALEGVGGMIVNSIGSRIYILTGNEMQVFTMIVRIYAVLNLVAAIGMYFFLSDIETKEIQGHQISFSLLKYIYRRKEIWLIAVITMCNFVMYCSLTYITPYLTDVYIISESRALIYGIIRVNILTFFSAIIFGKLSDIKQSALYLIKWIMPVQSVILVLLISNGMTWKNEAIAVIITLIYAFIATGVKAICFVLITESGIPMFIMGTAIGLVSFVGYSPDAFLYPITGKLLETYSEQGYCYLFFICLIATIIAYACCKTLWKIRRKDCEKGSSRVSDVAEV